MATNRTRHGTITHLRMVFGILLSTVLLAGAGCMPDGDGDTGWLADVLSPNRTPARLETGRIDATAADKFSLWQNMGANGVAGVQLRGANIYQRIVYPAVDGKEVDGTEFLGPGPVGPPFAQGDFDRLAAAGCNYVNVSHPGIFTQKPPYEVDPELEANLDRLLDMIAQARMYAVICFRSGPGRSEFSIFARQDWYPQSLINDAVWTSRAAQDAWLAMWRYTANRYRGNPVVIGYDLMVEPNSGHVLYDQFDAAEFHLKYGGSLADWNQLYPRISAAVREVDTTTPILVSAGGYGSIDWLPYLVPTGDNRTIYTVHFYEPVEYTHREGSFKITYPGSFDTDHDGEADAVNQAWLRGRLQPAVDFSAAFAAPVAITEFGVKRYEPGAVVYLQDVLAVLESMNMNHAIWLWTPAWAAHDETDDFDFRHGQSPRKHADAPGNPLERAVFDAWSMNSLRPG